MNRRSALALPVVAAVGMVAGTARASDPVVERFTLALSAFADPGSIVIVDPNERGALCFTWRLNGRRHQGWTNREFHRDANDAHHVARWFYQSAVSTSRGRVTP